MKVNNINTSFSGNLILKNQKLWTKDMLNAVRNNASIQKKLSDYDIIGNISSKIEKKEPSFPSMHRRGDKIYKVNFVVKDIELSFVDKIKDLFGLAGKKYNINRHFHSESTTVNRINKLDIK